MRFFIVVQVAVISLATFISKMLARNLSSKLSRVAEHVQRLSVSGNQRGRLVVHGEDEVDQLADQFNKLLDRVESAQVDLLESQRLHAFNELATQVAHDIRSPLAALVAFEKTQVEISEERRLMLRAAVNRINDIANNLLIQVRAQTATETSERRCELIPATVSSLITEKRMQYRARIGVQLNLEVLPSAYGAFAKLSSSELKRVLSNLIDNAFEAIEDTGCVRVLVKGSPNHVKVAVHDDGSGIPDHVLAQLGTRGATGKEHGNGLGLYHAFKTVRAWQGDVRVTSPKGRGTEVELTLPRSETPSWFCSSVPLQRPYVVVVDDDVSIHNIWRERFSSLSDAVELPTLIHLATTEELTEWLAQNDRAQALFLIDFEFIGSDESGLAFIERHGLAEQSLLVTSRFEDLNVQQDCAREGLQIIPKSMALYVPLNLPVRAKAAAAADVILLDDDELVHSTWQLAAKTSGRSLWAFREPETLMHALTQVSPSTPIYVDHQLGGGRSGLDVVKEIMRRGYRNVRLATGDFALFAHLNDVVVVGKTPAAELN